MLENSDTEITIEGVVMTPTQLNEVIMEKLDLLAPKLGALRDDMIIFQKELTNGIIPWGRIFQKAGLGATVADICEEILKQ